MDFETKILPAILGILGGLFGAYLKHLLARFALSHKLKSEYEYDQRKHLQEIITRYYGRLLEASERLSQRFLNLQQYHDTFELGVRGKAYHRGYYFPTTVYRFMSVVYLIKKFEAEALYIDRRIAERENLDFVKYVKMLEFSLADVDLFDGLEYDPKGKDHFFRDDLSLAVDDMDKAGMFIKYAEFLTVLKRRKYAHLKRVLDFFDNLKMGEKRHRWDRVVCFQLMLLCFINSFGYDMQQTNTEELRKIANFIRSDVIKKNLVSLIKKFHLEQTPHMEALISILVQSPQES